MLSHEPPLPVETMMDVGGHQLAVVDGRAGRRGAPLVFLHGIALSVHLWPGLLKETPLDERPWISLSLPGHFPSTVPEDFSRDDVTTDLFVDCVMKPVEAMFGGEPAHLVGWSTGGFAALATAARRPELVRSVVSISGFARGKWGWHLGSLQVLAGGWLGRGILRTGMKVFHSSPRLFRLFKQSLAKQKLEVCDELMEQLFEDAGQHDFRILGRLMQGIRELDLTEELAQVQTEVLLLSGESDRVISAGETRHLQQNLPHARQVLFPEVGHMFYGESLGEYLGEISRWIDSPARRNGNPPADG